MARLARDLAHNGVPLQLIHITQRRHIGHPQRRFHLARLQQRPREKQIDDVKQAVWQPGMH